MSEVISTITLDIQRDATNYPLAGVIQKVLIIPGGELDPKADITSSTESLITDIAPSAAAHVIEGFGDKRGTNSGIKYRAPFTPSTSTRPGYRHVIENIPILDPSVEVRENLKDLAVGGDIVYALVQRKWEGTSREDAFLFFGYDCGLVVQAYEEDSDANEGVLMISLATPEGITESLPPKVYLNTNYATTETDVWTTKLA